MLAHPVHSGLFLGRCFQPIVKENDAEEYLSCFVGKFSLMLMRNKNSLCFSFHPSRGSTALSSFLSSFVHFLWCRFCFALMKKTGIHEWMLFWAQASDGHRRSRERWKTRTDLTPLCLLNHEKWIFLLNHYICFC